MVQVSKRHAVAKNKCTNPNHEGESNYILHGDANNLSGWAMSQKLPEKDFEWYEGLTEQDVRSFDPEGNVGYLVECDLGYSEHLHDLHNDYPFAPERMCVKADMLSPHTKEIYRKTYNLSADKDIKDESVEK